MKLTIDIPEKLLNQTVQFTGAKTRREAVLEAVRRFNRHSRLKELNARVRGKFVNFMTQPELKAIRKSDWQPRS